MATEIEAKLKVASLEEAEEQLKQLGGEFTGEVLQQDVYYDDSAGSFRQGDMCLRLRRESSEGKDRAILTYKGAKQGGKYKSRVEVEVEVSNAAAADELLAGLGYKKWTRLKKRRKIWRISGCEVLLDTVEGLGEYVEIEGGSSSDIGLVQEKLGLGGIEHTEQSYASMAAEKIEFEEDV